ncbi:reverse transcriptase domain-containing protein [Tanacetum coccineum]
MKVRENDKPSAQHSRFLKMFKQLRLEIGLKDALVKMPKFNKWLSTLLRNKEKLEEIAITTVNSECSAIILNKVPEKLEDPGKFLIPCALQELDRTSALADSGASINLLSHSIYMQLGLGALTLTRMTLELVNRSITHPMGIAEVLFSQQLKFPPFYADFVLVNFEPDPRVFHILGIHILRTAKSLIDLIRGKINYKERAIEWSVLPSHSRSLPLFFTGKTSDNIEEIADELTLLRSCVQDRRIFKFIQTHFSKLMTSHPSNVNPLLTRTDRRFRKLRLQRQLDSDSSIYYNAPLVTISFFTSEGVLIFLENLLSDDTTHNLAPEVISDHEPKQDESIHNTSITFSPRSDPLTMIRR